MKQHPMMFVYLDNNPEVAAQSLEDKDLRQTILYTALLVSKVVKLNMPDFDFKKHGYIIYDTDILPISFNDVDWLSESSSNWNWTKEYFFAMCKEYEHRFGSVHPSIAIGDYFKRSKVKDNGTAPSFTIPPVSVLIKEHYVDNNKRTKKQLKPDEIFIPATKNSYQNWYKFRMDHGIMRFTVRQLPEWLRLPPLVGEERPRPVRIRS